MDKATVNALISAATTDIAAAVSSMEGYDLNRVHQHLTDAHSNLEFALQGVEELQDDEEDEG